jgi:hypothetical protein
MTLCAVQRTRREVWPTSCKGSRKERLHNERREPLQRRFEGNEEGVDVTQEPVVRLEQRSLVIGRLPGRQESSVPRHVPSIACAILA